MVKQSGAAIWQMLIVVALIGIGGLVATRLVPVYMEGYFVRFALDRLEADRTLAGAGHGAVWAALSKQLLLDDVGGVKRENVSFEEIADGLQVRVNYETRVPLLGNLDGVVRFEDSAVIRR